MNRKHIEPFGRIAKDCREANVAFPDKLVEQFERVAHKLNEDWGTPEAAEYLNDLLFPSRPGRRGFPPEVANEILVIKSLHEERYAHVLGTVWDATRKPQQRSARDDRDPAQSRDDTQPRQPSIYATRSKMAAKERHSASVARLMPKNLREQLTRISTSQAMATGPASPVPAPASELEELLLDAERLFEENHLNSGSALLEQLTTLFPESSPYAYLRLMEIYFRMQRQEDFDWASQRLSEQFGCDKLDWVPEPDAFMANLDRLAEKFLSMS